METAAQDRNIAAALDERSIVGRMRTRRISVTVHETDFER